MKSASQLLHAHVGAPAHEDCASIAPTPCWNCGGTYARGVDVHAFMKASLTDQNTARAPSSPYVCEACVYVRARFSPVPGRPPKEGKEQGGRFCNYSHLYVHGVSYANASKGEKPVILAFLRTPHASDWFAAIADSGQKHTLPYAPVNPGGSLGRVRFDESFIALPDERGWTIVDDLRALLTAGATKEEIGRGAYEARAWTLCPDLVRGFEATHGAKRGSDLFRLALWLSQRDDDVVAARMSAEKEAKKPHGKTRRTTEGTAPNPDRGGPARGARDVPRDGRKRAEALGSTPEPEPQRSEAQREPGRVDDAADARASDRRAEQLSLFGAS